MSELGIPFLKNHIEKKQKYNVKKPHVNKKIKSDKLKFGSNKKRPRMNDEWIGKTN